MTTADILERAQQALLTRGWTQGTYGFDDGAPVCIAGAVMHVCGGFSLAALRVIAVLGETAGVRHVPTWNDTPGRTPEQVLDLFDRAIARAHQEEAAAIHTAVEVA